MQSVLVTGASGFVGRHLCASLATRGAQMIVLQHRTAAITPGVRVTPFEPVNSVLYLLVQSGTMPGSGRRLTSVELAIIRKWIEDGAPDN